MNTDWHKFLRKGLGFDSASTNPSNKARYGRYCQGVKNCQCNWGSSYQGSKNHSRYVTDRSGTPGVTGWTVTLSATNTKCKTSIATARNSGPTCSIFPSIFTRCHLLRSVWCTESPGQALLQPVWSATDVGNQRGWSFMSNS